jgi:hypothetical protein
MLIVVAEFHSSSLFPSIFYWRLEMIKFKSTLNFVIVFSALFGLVFVIGCGTSPEKQAMSDYLKLYNDSVNEYSTADDSKRAGLKEKLDTLKAKWWEIKIEMDGEVTPQALNELEKEYEKITKKYVSSTS